MSAHVLSDAGGGDGGGDGDGGGGGDGGGDGGGGGGDGEVFTLSHKATKKSADRICKKAMIELVLCLLKRSMYACYIVQAGNAGIFYDDVTLNLCTSTFKI